MRRRTPLLERLEDRRLLAVGITEISIPTASSNPVGIVAGPDGNIWFTESSGNQIGVIDPTTQTVIHEYAIPTASSDPQDITVGPDGELWFTEQGANAIAEIAPGTGSVQQYPIASPAAFPSGITTGPDHNVWFAETLLNEIGVYNPTTQTITQNGTLTQNAEPLNITAGASGDPNLYFTEQLGNAIGVFNTSTGSLNEIPTPTSNSNPIAITAGPGGDIWFTEGSASAIGVLDPTTGVITEYPTPTPNSVPNAIVEGPGGFLWFTEAASNKVGMIDPANGQITEYNLPSPDAQPSGIALGPDGNLWVTEQGANAIAVITPSLNTANAPQLEAQDDTGVSDSDGITRNNGSASAPLTFNVSGVIPANGFVQLYDGANPVGSPVQASGGDATITLDGAPLADGVHQIAVTVASTSGGTQGALSAATTIQIQTSLTITGTNPSNGAVVQSLPNGQVVITFSHVLSGLTSGGPALSAADPYAVFLLARGPAGAFSAPSGIDAGDLPLPEQTEYVNNGNGTSSIIITPTAPLSADVFLISITLADFSDLAGNTLTDPQGGGYRTFLLQPPPATSSPLQVTGVTTYDGSVIVNNNAIDQPDTLTIGFNQPLFAGAAQGDDVQLIANPGPSFTVVPSVAAYSPTTDSIELTPTATLTPGTIYAVRVDASVSNDQGYGNAGFPLGQTYYDTFTVLNPPIGAGTSPLTVANDANGNPRTTPASSALWTQPMGYASIAFTEAINMDPSVFGRYSVMLVPQSGGLNPSAFDGADLPLNATLAFNPNTDQLIIVPSQPTGNDIYLYALSSMQAANGDPLLNNAGQPAGQSGNAAYYQTFELQVGSQAPSIRQASRSAALEVESAPSAAVTPSSTQGPPSRASDRLESSPPKRPTQAEPTTGALRRWRWSLQGDGPAASAVRSGPLGSARAGTARHG